MPKKKEPNAFTIRLNHCGNMDVNSSYALQSNSNAVKLIASAVKIMAEDMVGKDSENMCMLTVGLLLLKRVYKDAEKIPVMKDLDGFLKDFEIAQEGRENNLCH